MKSLLRIVMGLSLFFVSVILYADFARGYLDNLTSLQKDAKQYLDVSEYSKKEYDEASRLRDEAEKEHSKGDYAKSTDLARKSEQKFQMIIRTKGKGAQRPGTKTSGDQTVERKKAEDMLASVRIRLAGKDRGDSSYAGNFKRIDLLVRQAESAMTSKYYSIVISNCNEANKELDAVPDKTSGAAAGKEENDDVAKKKSEDKIREARALREQKTSAAGGGKDSNLEKGDKALKRAEEQYSAKQYGNSGRSADEAKGFYSARPAKKTNEELYAEVRAKKSREADELIRVAEEKKKNSVLKHDNLSYIRAEEDLAKAKEFYAKGAYESAMSKAKQAAKKFDLKN